MAHRIDTVMQAMQSAAGQAVVYRIFSKPKLHQLRACDHTLLPLR